MGTRMGLAVALSSVVLLAGIGPVGGLARVDRADGRMVGLSPVTPESTDKRPAVAGQGKRPAVAGQSADAQYEVTLMNVTIRTWLLRNATVMNATVDTVVVRNVTTTDGVRLNVTLSNVTVGRFFVERGRLRNVTARKLVIRNKSVLSVPGGAFISPTVENQTIQRHVTQNNTVVGVAIDRIVVDAATLCGNASIGREATGATPFNLTAVEQRPDITLKNGTVDRALVAEGRAANWSVGSMDGFDGSPANATMPAACS